MKYRTKLGKEKVDFIKKLWEKQVLADSINKAKIARECMKEFEKDLTENAWRHRVGHLVEQFEETMHRGNTLNEFVEQEDITPRALKHAWIKTKLPDGTKVSGFVKNPNYEQQLIDLQDRVIEEMGDHAPKYPKINRKKVKDGHLLVIDPADIHLGKLCSEFSSGDSYDSQTAIKRCIEGVEGILQKAQGYNIDHVLFIGGNDILHIDNPKRKTTSGTPQDTDGMWHDNYLLGQKLYVDILEMLMGIADVTFLFCPSNHDYTNGFFLCQSMEAWFRNCEHIEFMCDLQHRKYFMYGNSLIGASHGDGSKEKDLPMLMSVEAKEYWTQAEHRYWYLHHKHHKISKDYIGVTVEYLRSPSGTDRRHNDNGYTGIPKAIEGFIHHKEFGQIARFTHPF